VTGAADRAPSLARRGFWAVRDWMYAAAWQVRSVSPTTVDDYRTGDKQVVVVLPGVYETWPFLRPLMDALHERGHPVLVVAELKHNLRPVPESARVVIDVLAREGLDRVLLLSHSKGGLIGKYAMTNLDDEHRIDRMIAIATPFSGSAYARFAPARHLRWFRAVDPVVAALIRDVETNRRITSIYGVFDTMIPGGSELPGATNVRLPVGGHFAILGDARTREAVVRAAEAG
jgi:alpha-beta hydrolase superfamily lysophospholipase